MHQVRYFLAVARTLNFTRAAEESNVTQPSLTRAIQKLEEEFGGLLFRRERSLTHLTELGRMMLPFLERAFEAAQAAKQLAKGVGKASVAPLSLGIAANLHGSHLDDAIAEVGAGLPGFQLRIKAGDQAVLLDELLKGEVDMVIVAASRTVHDRVDALVLFEQAYAVAVRDDHELATLEAPDLSALHEAKWIAVPGDLHDEFIAHCTAAEIAPDLSHSASTHDDAARMVRAGLGCALLVHDDTMPPGIAAIVFAGLDLKRQVVLATVSGRQRSVAMDALIRAARARSWA